MKKVYIIAAILVISISLSACFSYRLEETQDDSHMDISPQQSSDIAGSDVVLYFRSYNQDYLIGEMREIPLHTDRMIEETLINELITGPQSEGVTSLIPAGTELINISKTGEYIYVTLSNDFYNVGAGVPEEWEVLEEWSEQVYAQRRMAIYSIVNTLTETGSYSRVQILIDETGDGQGKRPIMSNMGIETTVRQQLLEPLARDDSYIINPINTMEIFLHYSANKQWNDIVDMIADHDPIGLITPEENTILSNLTAENMTITMYRLGTYNVLQDGSSAVVMMDYAYQKDNGKTEVFDDVPVRLIFEDGIWKISYQSFYQIMQR